MSGLNSKPRATPSDNAGAGELWSEGLVTQLLDGIPNLSKTCLFSTDESCWENPFDTAGAVKSSESFELFENKYLEEVSS
jgi:hypothetical protein